MSYQIKNSSTAYPLVFMMVDSADHVTGKTGLSPTVTLSKAGAAFASASGAVTEIGSGWYKVAGNTTDSNTHGPLILHATATGADPTDALYEVVAYDPQDTVRLGLTAMPNVASGGAGAIITSGTGTAQLKVTSGIVDLPAITSGWLTAAGIATSALNGKGDWNIGKTGYSLTQAFPTNFASMSITASGLVDITQAAADKAWGTTTRVLTGGTNIALAKGTGVTGFNDLDASGVATAVWNAATATYGSAGSYALLIETNLDAKVSTVGGGSLTAAGIASAVWEEALSSHTTGGSAGKALSGAGAAGDPWGVTLPGSYGTGTAGYIMGALNTKIGYLPSATAGAAGGLFIAGSNAATTVNITGNIIGNITGNLSGSVGSVTGHTPQTGDTYARLGVPAGASIAADIAGVQADTNDIQTRLPAALVGGRMDSNMSSINNTAATFNAFERAVKGNVIGTVGVGSTTTSIVASSVTPAPSGADQLKGRLLTFTDDTTTAALRGQSTDITGSTASATPTPAVTALTTPPASTDKFSIT